MVHRLSIRVYYEDTDMAGIVYHANYLKFAERGRSDWVRGLGVDQNAMKEELGVVFVVRRMEVDFLAPARLDDVLSVETELSQIKGASFVMDQRVLKGEQVLFTARVLVAVMDAAGRPTRLPGDMRAKMAG